MNHNLYLVLAVAIMSVLTAGLRFLPFLLVKDPEHAKGAKFLNYLGDTLPYALMAMLVVYCLREIKFDTLPHWAPAAIASIATIGLYAWRRSMLLAILAGTILYMALVQAVF